MTARFGDLVAAEWIKTRSLRSSWWTAGLTVLFVTGSAAAAALSDEAVGDGGFRPFDAFPAAGYWTLMLIAAGVGALGAVGEYSSGLICATTVAVPARGSVVLAKAAVTAAVWTVVGTACAAGSYLAARAVLGERQAGVSLDDPGVLRALAASALLAPVCALVGLGLGVLIRHGAASIGAGVFALLMLPAMLSDGNRWSADVKHALVGAAWKRLVETWEPDPHSLAHTATVPGSWTVYLLWPLVAVALAVHTVRHRDV
ncbi:ABC transporter permease [Kitasatospora sp. NPDC048365]|uniref:ABC transporter permease n=1 Tax=Kitasatospora sp. NPDC048365 TaxID=3364050 RepID=UPI0037237B1B